MAIEKYQGKYIIAEDATKTIDMPTIIEGCRMLKEASEKLEQLSRKIDVLRQTCDRNAISIGGKNMEEMIEVYEKNTSNFSDYINELSNTLINTTQRVVNRKQTILNEEARRLDEKEAALHNDIQVDTNTTNEEEFEMADAINEEEVESEDASVDFDNQEG